MVPCCLRVTPPELAAAPEAEAEVEAELAVEAAAAALLVGPPTPSLAKRTIGLWSSVNGRVTLQFPVSLSPATLSNYVLNMSTCFCLIG